MLEIPQGLTLVSMTALIVYDCLLTVSREIQLVWHRRVTPVTLMYCMARYGGLINVVLLIIRELHDYSFKVRANPNTFSLRLDVMI